MNEELENESLESFADFEQKSLPSFLNALTILTFIGSGLGLISALYSLATIEQQKIQIKESERLLGVTNLGRDLIETAKLSLEHVIPLQLNILFTAIICLIGAFLMRKLNKTGFYVYLFGTLVSVIAPIAILGISSGLSGQLMIIGIIVPLVFIVMYATNLKHME